jgi:hypothetical protein
MKVTKNYYIYLVQYNNTKCLFDVGRKCGKMDIMSEEDQFCLQPCGQ